MSKPPQPVSAKLLTGLAIASPGGASGGGGMGSVSRTMQQWLRENRTDILSEIIDPRGERFALLQPLFFARAVLRLMALRLTGKAQVLHLQVSHRGSFLRKGLLLQIGRALGFRTVLHHHGSEFVSFFDSASPLVKRFVRHVVSAADVNVVLGSKFEGFLKREVGADASRLVVLPNATNDIGQETSKDSVDPWHLLIVANLVPRKGIAELLQAVAKLAAQGHAVRLTLVGGGDVERYRREAGDLGVEDRCTFTGWLSGTARLCHFHTSGMLVLPSFNEGLPMAVLEALSARLPVVTTPVGSLPEVLIDAQTCLFVQPGEVDELAAAIERLATDGQLRDVLKKNGRDLYERDYHIDAYMVAMLKIYQMVLAEPHTRPLANA